MRKAILLVESDPYSRVLLGRFLQWEGYEVIFARNVQAAIERVQGVQGDISLAVVNLVDESDRPGLKNLQQMLPHVRILLLSVLEGEETAYGCEASSRPFYPEALVVQVKKILAKTNGHYRPQYLA